MDKIEHLGVFNGHSLPKFDLILQKVPKIARLSIAHTIAALLIFLLSIFATLKTFSEQIASCGRRSVLVASIT